MIELTDAQQRVLLQASHREVWYRPQMGTNKRYTFERWAPKVVGFQNYAKCTKAATALVDLDFITKDTWEQPGRVEITRKGKRWLAKHYTPPKKSLK